MRDAGDTHPQDVGRPKLTPDCLEYYDAYRALGMSRIYTQVGPTPLQMTEIEAYLRLNGITDQPERLKYLRLIQRLDRAELAHIYRKSKAAK